MTDPPIPVSRREIYAQGDNPAFDALLAARTAPQEAEFFLPYLRPDMRLLDVGCGPGSITLGLADTVAPGEVVGIDARPVQLEQATALAAQRGVTNVRFEVANVYELPFSDHSFDAAFANAVLMHLREPVKALQELRRVLRPGGIVGIRDPDFGANLFVPTSPVLDQWRTVMARVRDHRGDNPIASRHYRRLLLEAGFESAEASASVRSGGALAETRGFADFQKTQMQGFAPTALAKGWVDQVTVDAVAAYFDEWAERPDAFYAVTWCVAVGWTEGDTVPNLIPVPK